MKKLVVILGQTASGKSALAVRLAKKFNGEIISADSRQLYKGLEIGSGKITKKEMSNVPHYLLSVVSPKKQFTVTQYRKLALKAIESAQNRDKLPFLVGGSPFYIYAVTDGIVFPEVPPNQRIRKELEKYSTNELFEKLKKLDPARAKTIEVKNRRRLVRALEIVLVTKKVVGETKKNPPPYPVLFLGIRKSPTLLKRDIKKRFLLILKRGFLKEIKELHKRGLSWKRIESFGLEYKEGSQYIQGKITRQEMIEKAVRATEDFARRQMTWFKKDQRICWVKNYREAKNLISSNL